MNISRLIISQIIPEIKNTLLVNLIKNFPKEIKLLRKIGFKKAENLINPHYFIHLPKCAGNSIKQYLKENKFPTIILGHSIIHFINFLMKSQKAIIPMHFAL